MTDLQYMKRALQLAALGAGRVAPNPMVGCVIVHENTIIGEGYHKTYGTAHAEVEAIDSVAKKELLPASTAYVTLEPCAHFGKTPPCADLLIKMQLKRIVIACRDPFEEVNGKGIEKIKAAGINVDVGILEQEAKELNKRFFKFHQDKRPYVTLKWAETTDHFIARKNYDSKWISNQYSRQIGHKWRTEETAILVGKNTALFDNPELTARSWQGQHPVRIQLDKNLETPNTNYLLDNQHKTIIFNCLIEEEKENIKWIKLEELSSSEILKKLYEQNLQSLLIEGGAKTINSFIKDNLWDEARIFSSNTAFKEGIKAPVVKGKLLAETTLIQDKVKIIKNHG